MIQHHPNRPLANLSRKFVRRLLRSSIAPSSQELGPPANPGRFTVCRRLMSAPGVGPVVAITFKTAVDDPTRIRKSKHVGPLFGLTPKKYQSGETDVTGGITRVGDEMVRTALYEAANILLSRVTRFSVLKRWGMDIAKRRGTKRAKVALARKIGVILHRMWIDGTSFRWTKEPLRTKQLERAC